MPPCGAWHPSSPPSSPRSRGLGAARTAASSASRRSPPTSRARGSPAAAMCTAAARRTRCARGRCARLQTEALHRLGGVALALGGADRERLVELLEVLVGQVDVRGCDVLLEVLDALGARDRHDVVTAREDPGDRDLARLHVVLLGDLLDGADEFHVLVEDLALEARVVAAEVVVRQVVRAADGPGEESAPQRRVRDEADPQLTRGVEDAVLGIAGPERVLGLKGADRMNLVRAPDGLRAGLGQAQIADLAGVHELLHRPDGLLYLRVRVDAVLVVEVDVVDVQALERCVAGLTHVLGVAADAQALAVLAADVAELGGEHDLVAAVGDRVADELLVREGAIHVGRVEQSDAQLERPVDGAGGLALVGLAVELRHPHAAEALLRDLESLLSKLSVVHTTRGTEWPACQTRAYDADAPFKDWRLRSCAVFCLWSSLCWCSPCRPLPLRRSTCRRSSARCCRRCARRAGSRCGCRGRSMPAYGRRGCTARSRRSPPASTTCRWARRAAATRRRPASSRRSSGGAGPGSTSSARCRSRAGSRGASGRSAAERRARPPRSSGSRAVSRTRSSSRARRSRWSRWRIPPSAAARASFGGECLAACSRFWGWPGSRSRWW